VTGSGGTADPDSEEARPPGFRDALRHREFRLLLGSYAVSWTGDWCYSVALTVWVLQRTHSTTWVAALVVIRILPYVLFGAFGGVVADRLDRRRLMVVVDLARAVLMVPLIVVVASDGPVIVAALVTFGLGVVGSAYRPAVVAATPGIVGESDLAAANALESVCNQVTLFIGPALASLLLTIGSPQLALGFNAVTFLLAAALVAGVRSAGGRPRETAGIDDDDGDTADDGSDDSSGILADLGAGVRTLREIPGLVAFTILLVASTFAFGAEEIFKVLVATDNLASGARSLGLLGAAMGVGGLVIAPFTARLMGRARLASVFIGSLILTGITNALLALPRSLMPALVVLFFEGIALIVYEVAAVTLLQRTVPTDRLGRVSGLQDSLCTAGIVLGTLAAPVAIGLIGLDAALVALGVTLVVGSVVAFPSLREFDRAAAVQADLVAPAVVVLERLPIFQGASREALERIAAAITEDIVPAGTRVVAQGDPADDLFIVRTGHLDVLDGLQGDGRPETAINALGPDDVFGEIGLVQRRPRTATVVAAVESTLWRVPGPTFLDAVIGNAPVPTAIAGTIGTRLERTARHRAGARSVG
jgi:predicted MFS family arabinose efflux permease